jgi:hypothetical protein
MLSLKFTFDNFYFLKSISNKIEQEFISVYMTNSTCKMSFYHCYTISYIIWIKIKIFLRMSCDKINGY